MDTGSGGCGSNSKYDASNTVPSWSNDALVVEALTVTQGPTLETRNPQNLPARERTPSRNTNPPQNNWLLRQQGRQSDLPTRQALLQTNIQKIQGQGPQIPRVPRIRIKMKDSVTGYVPSRLSDRTLEKKPCDENQQGTVTVTRNLPTVSAGELPSDQETRMTTTSQSLTEPKAGIGKRKDQLVDMKLDETKRKLHGAYQEAEKAKKKRAIQVLELRDIPKSKDTSFRTH
ncbi:hypothetical protein HU200_056857 [Digitaria exilis]|uniref:Uncharacterized protein n=1 Tax=Digitaria exilis TaxID=1010633 RepID=A0A835AGQ3_9POAL|nr:hypothetical protein HU200_056857 [Digitaria exilis]